MAAARLLARLFRERARRPRRPRAPLLSQHTVHSPRLHLGVDGVRIAQLSDIHVRTGVRHRALFAAVELINELKPDLVCLTGDYVVLSPRPLPQLTDALARLRAPAFATLGNHDHWSDARAVRRALHKAGVDVLTNEHRVVHVARGRLHLVGIDDSITGHAEPDKAFADVPTGACCVALSHDPGSADWLHRFAPALILSGHTHGGQVFVEKVTPFLSARAGVKYLSGFFEVEGCALFVNRGLGASVPVRFRAPAEIAELTLRHAPRLAVPAEGRRATEPARAAARTPWRGTGRARPDRD